LFSVETGSAVAAKPARQANFESPEKSHPPVFAGRGKQKLILCLALFAATLVFYNPISHDGFILLDDVPYILSNPPVKAGLSWSTVKWAFTTFHAGYWHPLTWLSHALDCQLFGQNPAGHHYVSLLFHAANAVLLFLVLEEATAVAWPSLIVAAIFALHPVNVESVAWAAERKNVLSMFFFLLAMLVYGRYARRGGTWRYVALNACFALGMMAKPQIITLPFVLLLWDYWPLNRLFAEDPRFLQNQRNGAGETGQIQVNDEELVAPRSLTFLLLEKIPLFVIVLAGSVLTFLAQRSAGAVQTLGDFSLKIRLENALVSYAKYLRMLVWPWHLAPLYPHPGSGIPMREVAVSSVILAALTIIAWRYGFTGGNSHFSQNRRAVGHRYLAVGWLWFLGVLVPMIGIVQVGEQAMADRFAYIPMIGILIAVVWAVWDVADERAIAKTWIAVPATLIVLMLGALTYYQLGYWKDGETLWRYTLSVTEGNYMAHDDLAMVLDKEGRVEEAIPEFIQAESLHAYPLLQVLSMGVYLQRHGHVQDAMKMYEKVANKAEDARLRSTGWDQLGAANVELQDYEQSRLSYERALEINPSNAAALIGSALLAERHGDSVQAIAELSRSAKIEANDMTLLLLADALDRAGRSEDAQTARQSAEKISADISQARQKADNAESFFGLMTAGLMR
jgi:protein O-mannosyl-transferase